MRGLLVLNFIIPGVMLLCSLMLKKMKTPYPGPPRYRQRKWKVDFSGYNTPQSRKSQAHWDYAQQIAPEAFFYYGKWLAILAVVLSSIGLLSPGSVDASVTISLVFGFTYMFRAFYAVEKKLKERFGE